MLELGQDSDRLHREIGRLAVEHGVDELFAVGDEAEHIVAGAVEAGGLASVLPREEVAARIALGRDDVVLVKASRGIGLEVVADELARALPAADGVATDGDAQ